MIRDAGSGDDTAGRTSGGATASDGPDGAEPRGDVRCKLLRSDGSEWTVTDLDLEADGLHVDAYRYVRGGHAASEARRETMRDELLALDDRVWCLNRRGAVIWALSHPDATGSALDEPGGAADAG